MLEEGVGEGKMRIAVPIACSALGRCDVCSTLDCVADDGVATCELRWGDEGGF